MQSIHAVKPRLSDEDLDPLEADDAIAQNSHQLIEGWKLWDAEDVTDVHNVIARLETRQREIVQAFLEGLNYYDIDVTEKFYRYHLAKAIKCIQKELKI